jgi:predicted methyltransferase
MQQHTTRRRAAHGPIGDIQEQQPDRSSAKVYLSTDHDDQSRIHHKKRLLKSKHSKETLIYLHLKPNHYVVDLITSRGISVLGYVVTE